ncbi:hypothetical protein BH09PSE1_BH09PSE1_15740 [soil metagenome]
MRGIYRIVADGEVTGVLIADDEDKTATMSVENYVDQDIQPPLATLDVQPET